MSRLVGRTFVLFASILVAAAAARPVHAQDASQQGAVHPTVTGVAAQLGAKAQGVTDDEFQLGNSFTAVLEQPDKLAELGIQGMHAGARVTVARIAPDKVRVEVDEMEPVAHSGSVSLRLNVKGELSKLSKS